MPPTTTRVLLSNVNLSKLNRNSNLAWNTGGHRGTLGHTGAQETMKAHTETEAWRDCQEVVIFYNDFTRLVGLVINKPKLPKTDEDT